MHRCDVLDLRDDHWTQDVSSGDPVCLSIGRSGKQEAKQSQTHYDTDYPTPSVIHSFSFSII